MARFAANSSFSISKVATAIVFCSVTTSSFAAGTDWQARKSLTGSAIEAVQTNPDWQPRSSLAGRDAMVVGSISAKGGTWKPRAGMGGNLAPLVVADMVTTGSGPIWKPRSSMTSPATTSSAGRPAGSVWKARSSLTATEQSKAGHAAERRRSRGTVAAIAPVVLANGALPNIDVKAH